MDQHLNFQRSFRDVIQEKLIIAFELLHQLVLCCAISEYYWKEGFHIR